MKLSPKEYSFNICWCGHLAKDHPRYVEYTGYICIACDKCLDFNKTVDG